METVSLKIGDAILIRMDEAMKKHNYTPRSEFIQDAIREKLEQLENQKLESEIRAYLHTSTKNREVPSRLPLGRPDIERARQDIFVELERRFDELREQSP